MDPTDDVQVTASLLERHDPASGFVVVHPTPGASSMQAFAHDLLSALGRAVNRLTAEQLTDTARTFQAAAAWLITDQINDLVVLRADRLSAATWNRLLTLCQQTGSRLLLVCHTDQVPAPLGVVLTGTGHQVLTAVPGALPQRQPACSPQAAALDPPTDTRDVAELPPLPATGVAHFRAEAFRVLDAAAFSRLDAIYRYGLEAARDWLSTLLPPDQSGPGSELVQLFLTGLVYDSPTRAHTLARLRGAQAGFLGYGLLLGVPSSRDILDILSGPGLNALPVTTQIIERIRAGVASPMVAAGLVTALFTGISPRGTSHARQDDLSPALRAAWRPLMTQPVVLDSITRTAPTLSTIATFYVPAPARLMLRAASHFAASQPSASRRRLFTAPAVTDERIKAAAANCQVTLPRQLPALAATWQIRVTCDPIDAPAIYTPPHSPTPGGQPELPRICDQLSELAPARYGRTQTPATHPDDDRAPGRRHLTSETAAEVLHLIHDHLNAVPGQERHRRNAGRSWMLIRRQLACYPRAADAKPAVLTPHPDVLFALLLTGRPAEITAPGHSFVRNEAE